jgi:hypothetical protein
MSTTYAVAAWPTTTPVMTAILRLSTHGRRPATGVAAP